MRHGFEATQRPKVIELTDEGAVISGSFDDDEWNDLEEAGLAAYYVTERRVIVVPEADQDEVLSFGVLRLLERLGVDGAGEILEAVR